MNQDYALGIGMGVLVALIFYAVVRKFSKGKMNQKLDERQMAVQGKAYKNAYFTTLVLLLIEFVMDASGVYEMTILTHPVMLFLFVMIGILVFAVESIMNDSYYGIESKNNIRTYKACIVIIVIANLCNGLIGLKDGMIENGNLVFGSTSNWIIVVAFAILGIASYIRSAQRKKEEAGLDEEE